MAPTFTSMLQQSQVLGVSLVHILSDPAGAAKAAGELALGGEICSARQVKRIRPETVEAIRVRLEKEIRDSANAEVASFRALARDFGVLPSTINLHLRELADAHRLKRKEFLASSAQLRATRLLEALDGGLIEEYCSRRIRSIDDLARSAHSLTGAGIAACRKAISQRLESRNPAGS